MVLILFASKGEEKLRLKRGGLIASDYSDSNQTLYFEDCVLAGERRQSGGGVVEEEEEKEKKKKPGTSSLDSMVTICYTCTVYRINKLHTYSF